MSWQSTEKGKKKRKPWEKKEGQLEKKKIEKISLPLTEGREESRDERDSVMMKSGKPTHSTVFNSSGVFRLAVLMKK